MKIWRRTLPVLLALPLLALAALALSPGNVSIPAWAEGSATRDRVHIADCDLVMAGSGEPSWRRDSLHTSRLGMRRRPLRRMSPASPKRPGRGLTTKAPIIVEGHAPVIMRVPPPLRGRVFLYYGPNNARQFSFTRFRGFSTIEFRPCADRPRTVWPGGLRVIGRKPVSLIVDESGDRPVRLRFGRPN